MSPMEGNTLIETLSVPASVTATTAPPKPIKLRSACNQCFSAKVKCDGNKSGCVRCSEKNLSCTFSESRVGKVVGKRRKRPLEESIGSMRSEAWVANNYYPCHSILSPATTTTSSDENPKRPCTDSHWTCFIADEDTPLAWDIPDEQREQYAGMDQLRCFPSTDVQQLTPLNGLPTPALSPPPVRYLSPKVLDAPRPASRQSTTTTNTSNLRPASPALIQQTPILATREDEEMTCLRLLIHVKKQSQIQHTVSSAILLLQNWTAALKRILASKTARADYSIQLLLTNILTSLVAHCERTTALYCTSRSYHAASVQSLGYQLSPEQFDPAFTTQHSSSPDVVILKDLLQTALKISGTLSDSLKRKPLNGFQTLGRHESLMLTLAQRLTVSLNYLS